MAAKIRKGDRVQVLTGRDKGKRGEVIAVNPTHIDSSEPAPLCSVTVWG